MEKVYLNIFHHSLLNKIISDLTYNQFISATNIQKPKVHVEYEHLKKCIWLCSLLSQSPTEEHRRKVQLFTSLAYLQNADDINIERVCYLLCSRVGNLTATRLFKNFLERDEIQPPDIYKFDAGLNWELGVEWHDKNILIDDNYVLTSSFQKKLWSRLKENDNVAISAPTSAGKSYILKRYVNKLLREKTHFKVLYIVPSKALINQVSEEFRKEVDLNVVDVKTAVIEEEQKIKRDKEVYILTPERSLRLIQSAKIREINVDFVFVDEIQNVEDENGRGSLLEHVLHELPEIFPTAQIVTAGPNINYSGNLFKKLFESTPITVETTVSPVFQIKTIIRPLENDEIKIILKNTQKLEQSFVIDIGFNLRKELRKSFANGLTPIIDFFSPNQQNIVYSPRTDYVESWATAYASESIVQNKVIERETLDLIEFLKEEIHPEYFLIKCLENKVAFHHSKLPDIVRKEIEDGYLEKRIQNLFCTSTLLEGVNLPATNLFVASPKKLNEELSPFEFGNLIGRAGRIKDSLYGTIYCIERREDENWAEDYYDKVYNKEVVPVSEKSLNDIVSLIDVIDRPSDEIKVPKHLNTTIALRHKYLDSPDILKSFLSKRNVNTKQSEIIEKKISRVLKNISIPDNIRKLNPSIDPIQQNKLHNQIMKDGVDQWLITPNKNFYNRLTQSDNEKLLFKDTSLYWQLVSIMQRLDNIFNISNEVYFKHQISSSIKQICFYGLRWMNSASYSEIIKADIIFYSKHTNATKRIDPKNVKAINTRINEVIKINSTLVSYVLVKYLKLTNDILEPMMTEEEKEKYRFSLSLPTSLELGSSEPTVKQLISRGVSRSVAIRIWQEFKKLKGHDQMDVFDWLKQKETLNLKPIYNRYVKRLKLLKD